MRSVRGLAGAALLIWIGAVFSAPAASACAVAPSVSVENRANVAMRDLRISAPERGDNLLSPKGLAPGDSVTIQLPSCLGDYEITAVLHDGRVIVKTVTGRTARGLIFN